NRVLIDHISDILFAPTKVSAENLVREGISEARTFITGNTIVDAVNLGLHTLELKSKERMVQGTVEDDGFFLMTLHREENVDSEERLRRIMKGISLTSSKP